MIAEQSLARFVDRHTLVYDRRYPHPIERVWEAVSTGEHLDVWMLPESRVERRAGGACAFGWGSPADDPNATRGTVSVFEPPTAIEYAFEHGAFMRFDLEADGASATVLHFTLHFPAPPGQEHAWHEDFLAGYHEFLDDLTPYLVGEWTADDRAAHLASAPDFDDRHRAYVARYREHLRDALPPA